MEREVWDVRSEVMKPSVVQERNPVARHFRDLITYQRARVACNAVFQMTKAFPKDERFELTSQMRRSARAVKAMVAAAWARRRYKAAFISKLDEALEEAVETQSWLDDALDRGYITETDFKRHDAEWETIAGLIQGMINRADAFCRYAPDKDHRTL
jgi:four helix bundle protein